MKSINPFDWEDQFPQVFKMSSEKEDLRFDKQDHLSDKEHLRSEKEYHPLEEQDHLLTEEDLRSNSISKEKITRKGFDAVIGNPPWFDIKGLNPVLVDNYF